MRDLKVIICGKLYDGIHAELQENKRILIRSGKILEVSENRPPAKEFRILPRQRYPVPGRQ